jgi:hypothetical protein
MNNGKVGAPFQYSDSYVQFLAFLKIGFKIPTVMKNAVPGFTQATALL